MEEIKYPEKTTEQAALESTQIWIAMEAQHTFNELTLLSDNYELQHAVNAIPNTDILRLAARDTKYPTIAIQFRKNTETGKVSLYLNGFRLYVVSGYVQRFINKAWDELVDAKQCVHFNESHRWKNKKCYQKGQGNDNK